MTSIEIEDIKGFMSHLFIKETFDLYLCKEITLQTFSNFQVDGRINKDFLDEAENAALASDSCIPWIKLKPYCFGLIKGNRTPLSIKAVFSLSSKGIEQFLSENQLSLSNSEVTGLYINIRFENGILNLITGTSLSVFTMDKTLDHLWDQQVEAMCKKLS